MTEYGVVLFFTTSSATQTGKGMAKAGLMAKLIPTPKVMEPNPRRIRFIEKVASCGQKNAMKLLPAREL